MSLKVNGVTIPETNGAIKVGATNVQKVVVNNTTVWEVPQGYTISWNVSLSKYGSFINSTPPEGSTTSKYGWKQIRYTAPDGSLKVANPYLAGSITIKKGSTVYLDMFAGVSSAKSYVNWFIGGSARQVVGNIQGILCSNGYAPTASGTLTVRMDNQTISTGGYKYTWYVNSTT